MITKINSILENRRVNSVPPPPKIYTIDSKTGLYNAFEILLNNNILSAPVYDDDKKEYIGFVDIRDLVSYVVYLYEHNKNFRNYNMLIKNGVELLKSPEQDGITLAYLSRRNKFSPVKTTDSLLQVANILSKGEIHRVPVLDNGKLVNIISQSTIIKIVANEIQEDIVQRIGPTIADMCIGTYNNLAKVSQNAPVISAFRLIDKYNLSGIALIDDTTGRITGVTTGKDLGLFLKHAEIQVLERPIGEYLKYIRSMTKLVQVPSITVYNKSKFIYAIGLIASTKVHRIFVVDDEVHYRPTGVISITDVLNLILKKRLNVE